MATAVLNPVIETISGRFGNVVFYSRFNRQCVRTYVVPANTDTVSRRKVRGNFALAVKSWQQMTADEKYAYTRKARHMNMSGYNLYISFFITGKMAGQDKYNIVSGKSPLRSPDNIRGRIHTVSLPFQPADKVKTYADYG